MLRRVSVERLIELLGHADPDWRRQGRELMKALGPEASEAVLRRCLRDGWLWPLGDGDASDLVSALAESEIDVAKVRELPPIATSDPHDVMVIARAFPHATLRLVWDRSPEQVAFLAELPCRKLQLSVGIWAAEPPHFSESLRRLTFFGGIPELHAPGLRELEVASWSSAWFETTFDRLAPQLERLHVLNRSGELPERFPRLRDLRIPELPRRLRTDAPLDRIHVGTHSRALRCLNHPDRRSGYVDTCRRLVRAGSFAGRRSAFGVGRRAPRGLGRDSGEPAQPRGRRGSRPR